jgi:hypothetical protein
MVNSNNLASEFWRSINTPKGKRFFSSCKTLRRGHWTVTILGARVQQTVCAVNTDPLPNSVQKQDKEIVIREDRE